MHVRWVGLWLSLHVLPAAAFDYLEHSYFTDRACLLAQRALAPAAQRSDAVAARYLALALSCPQRWDGPYCEGGYKQLEGGLNRLEAPPRESGDLSATLGDFAALPDHLAEFGALRGIPQAREEGLVTTVLRWLGKEGGVGGVIGDVAEDACETERPLDWAALDAELEGAAAALLEEGSKPLPRAWLSPLVRGPLERGVRDPSGAYSFDNPAFLDLVLQNHSHFGAAAHEGWRGFHATAVDVAGAACGDVLSAKDGLLEALADGRPAFEDVAWDALPEPERRARGCLLLGEHLAERVVAWSKRASPEQVAPVRRWVERLAGAPDAQTQAFSQRLVSGLLGSVLEGAGLHFLQDGFSAGHLRVDRAANDLRTSRYLHDEDSRHGLAARLTTPARSEELVLYGDGFLLGEVDPPQVRCPVGRAPQGRVETTRCLLERQRGWVMVTTASSLVDWALSGTEEEAGVGTGAGTPAPALGVALLPLVAPGTPMPGGAGPSAARADSGMLRNPPQPFSYQSLLFSTSVDAAGGAPEVGVRTVFLSELGSGANWMTSYHFGLLTRVGEGYASQALLEGAYMFHWRWAARFLINAGPFVFVGLGDLGDAPHALGGVGPSAGVTVLPEGWIRLPLELTFTYRVPVRLFRGAEAFTGRAAGIEAHWVELGVGLAFL